MPDFPKKCAHSISGKRARVGLTLSRPPNTFARDGPAALEHCTLCRECALRRICMFATPKHFCIICAVVSHQLRELWFGQPETRAEHDTRAANRPEPVAFLLIYLEFSVRSIALTRKKAFAHAH